MEHIPKILISMFLTSLKEEKDHRVAWFEYQDSELLTCYKSSEDRLEVNFFLFENNVVDVVLFFGISQKEAQFWSLRFQNSLFS